MKVLGRVVYALFMVILFWFMYDYAVTSMTNQYIGKYGKEALSSQPVNYDFFPSTVPGYRYEDVLYQKEIDQYIITFHEMVLVESKQNELLTKEYVYILIHDVETSIEPSMKFQITYQNVDETTYERFIMFPYRQFRNLMTVLSADEDVYIPKALLDHPNALSYQLIIGENIVVSEDLPLFDFKINTILQDQFVENQPFDQEELRELGVITYVPHRISEFMSTLWIAMGVYLIILVLFTYFTFFFKKKYLGKQKPTEGLQKDKASLKG